MNNSIVSLLLIQIILISDAVNEGFGVYEIELRYEEAGEAKK